MDFVTHVLDLTVKVINLLLQLTCRPEICPKKPLLQGSKQQNACYIRSYVVVFFTSLSLTLRDVAFFNLFLHFPGNTPCMTVAGIFELVQLDFVIVSRDDSGSWGFLHLLCDFG